jgi:hypothetical protein
MSKRDGRAASAVSGEREVSVVTNSKHSWRNHMTQETYIQASHVSAAVDYMFGGLFQG